MRPVDSTVDLQDAEARLPYWARSTNPIVRRHLGLYWRTVPPELRPILLTVGVWIAIILAGVAVPAVLDLTLMLFLASLIIMPGAVLLFGHILLTIAISATHTMQQELRNNTFNLLRATPMTLEQILLGKVAAALWKRMDDLVLVAQLAAIFSPPILFSMYGDLWTEGPYWLAHITIIIALITSLLRLILEPVMIGVISVFIGLVVPRRSMAITSSVALGGFYILLLNLARRLPGVQENPLLVAAFDFVLPLLLPVVIITGTLALARYLISSD